MLRCFGSVLLLAVIASTAFGKEKFQRSGPIHLDHGGEKWAEKTLRKLSLEEKIGQLFMIWVRAEFHEKLDRKSTRLNSSHVAISYAVFCLKKKKKKKQNKIKINEETLEII